MKIYFAWSIRWWRDDRGLYLQIISHLKQYGTVLTEHIADPDLNFDIADTEIYDADIAWLKESDLIVAEITQTSMWVWYELWIAESLWKPVLCLFDESSWKRPSAMISGNPHITLIHHDGIDDIKNSLDAYFKKWPLKNSKQK